MTPCKGMEVQLQALFKLCVGRGEWSTFLTGSFTLRKQPQNKRYYYYYYYYYYY